MIPACSGAEGRGLMPCNRCNPWLKVWGSHQLHRLHKSEPGLFRVFTSSREQGEFALGESPFALSRLLSIPLEIPSLLSKSGGFETPFHRWSARGK